MEMYAKSNASVVEFIAPQTKNNESHQMSDSQTTDSNVNVQRSAISTAEPSGFIEPLCNVESTKHWLLQKPNGL